MQPDYLLTSSHAPRRTNIKPPSRSLEKIDPRPIQPAQGQGGESISQIPREKEENFQG